jgi:hypothetical protein
MSKNKMIAILLLLLAVAALNACDQPASSGPRGQGLPLFVLERQGGIAGFAEKLVLGGHGEYYLERGGGLQRIGTLQAPQRGQLDGWREGFADFSLKLEDNPGGPDNLVRLLTWYGDGTSEATQAQQQEILDWAIRLLNQLSTAGG